MSHLYDYDIAIIGDGITGLSAAIHLQKLGMARLCLFTKPSASSSSSQSAGLITGGMLDNFTRLSHPRGMDTAKIIWNFADQAFDALREYLEKSLIPYQHGERLRWITSEAEEREAHQAIAQLSQLGFKGRWQSPNPKAASNLSGPLYLGTQNEGPRAAWVEPSTLLDQMRTQVNTTVFGEALALQSDQGKILVKHAQGEVRAEFVICAQHLQIGALLPNLASALVPVADQWNSYQLRNLSQSWPWAPGTVFSWQNSHIWGCITGRQSLHLGGARYLRPLAGIEADASPFEQKIVLHLAEAWNGLWPGLAIEPTARGFASRDCRPCDELALIGPMFGEGRILIATGYMGQGLALGFMAGRCLAELIAGKDTALPRLLWPERLRSLPTETGDGT